MMTNKKLWIYGGLILALLITLSVVFQGKEQQKTVIKIGQNSGLFASFPLLVAQEKGFFNKYGLEVQLKELEGNISVQALLAREIDYSSFTKNGVAASLKGAPIKTIMIFVENPVQGLISQPGLELNDLKTIGVANQLTSAHYLALKLIEENNLSAKIIIVGSSPATTALLIAGRVDAIIQSAPAVFRLQKEGHYIVLKMFEGEKIPQGLVATNDKIENKPEEVKKVIVALQSAVKFIKDNPRETKEIIFKFLNLEKNEANQEIIEGFYSLAGQYFLEKGVPSDEAINILIKLSKGADFKTFQDVERQTVTKEDISAVFDFRFVK